MAATVLLAAYGSNACADPCLQFAPLNPAFVKYQQDVQAGRVQTQTKDGHSLGYVPPPVDLSHLAGVQLSRKPALLSFPYRYDLRTLGKLTAVRDQGSCGSCWAFAAYGSLESYLKPTETWDFSENNLKNLHGFDISCCNGGNAFMATAYLARWAGPVNESDDPYKAWSCVSPSGLTVQKHVQEVIFIPGRSGPGNDNIKWAVMNYGAVDTAMWWDDDYYRATWASYFYPYEGWGNHYVCIVGWDDNYDKNRFYYDGFNAPAGNGAFICRNSFGESWGESGYFYVSYYDAQVGKENAVFTCDPTSNYRRVYQYDPLGWVTSVGFCDSPGETAWCANIFTSVSNESLLAVSTYAGSPDTAYELSVYTDPTADPRFPYDNIRISPTTGTLAASRTGTMPYMGYVTIPLYAPVALTAGHKFSVVFKFTTPGVLPVPIEER
ncbi:MAG: lectin like domain-containing protein, partial [Armatimonadetes bacterium]|nr:lectin like domain-containing protein [Armatimonadota bacterium]